MRPRAGWTHLRTAAIGSLLFAAATALTAQQPVVTTFTDAPGLAAAATEGTIEPGQIVVYCVYNVGLVQGNCGRFGQGSKLCINCPANGKCPGPPGQISKFVYVDAFGNVICKGDWARAFDPTRPDVCIECINGQTGYVFVN